MDSPWEDNLLERKTEGDLKDLLKTMVAFANSVRPGHIATILIGEKDDGTAQGVKNPDRIQMTIRREADKIYPTILWKPIIYEKDGYTCVRVEIEYDGETPHFGGIAWVRKGSETIKATDEVFQKLIELRTSKVRLISEWVGRTVSVVVDQSSINWGNPQGANFIGTWTAFSTATLVDVNRFWITLSKSDGLKQSVSTQKYYLDYDHRNDRVKIWVVFSGIAAE